MRCISALIRGAMRPGKSTTISLPRPPPHQAKGCRKRALSRMCITLKNRSARRKPWFSARTTAQRLRWRSGSPPIWTPCGAPRPYRGQCITWTVRTTAWSWSQPCRLRISRRALKRPPLAVLSIPVGQKCCNRPTRWTSAKVSRHYAVLPGRMVTTLRCEPPLTSRAIWRPWLPSTCRLTISSHRICRWTASVWSQTIAPKICARRRIKKARTA